MCNRRGGWEGVVVVVVVSQTETSSRDQIDWVTHATLASRALGGLRLMVLAVGDKVLFCSCHCVDVNGAKRQAGLARRERGRRIAHSTESSRCAGIVEKRFKKVKWGAVLISSGVFACRGAAGWLWFCCAMLPGCLWCLSQLALVIIHWPDVLNPYLRGDWWQNITPWGGKPESPLFFNRFYNLMLSAVDAYVCLFSKNLPPPLVNLATPVDLCVPSLYMTQFTVITGEGLPLDIFSHFWNNASFNSGQLIKK